MKIVAVLMMFFVAFTAIALAEESIEDAALDLEAAEESRCVGWKEWCSGSGKRCCGGRKCTLTCG
nr:Tx-273 [Heteropoda pingtungensis]